MKLGKGLFEHGEHLRCQICSEAYSLDHGERCDRKHRLVPYPPPQLSATEAVEAQLRAAKGGAGYGSLEGVYGYGHANRLLQWATRDQKLLKPKTPLPEKYTEEEWNAHCRDGAEITERGEEWLKEFGDSEAAQAVAESTAEQSQYFAERRVQWAEEARQKALQAEQDKLAREQAALEARARRAAEDDEDSDEDSDSA